MKELQELARKVFNRFKEYTNTHEIPLNTNYELGPYRLFKESVHGLFSILFNTPREVIKAPDSFMVSTEITSWGNTLVIPIELTKEELITIYEDAIKYLDGL